MKVEANKKDNNTNRNQELLLVMLGKKVLQKFKINLRLKI